MLKRHPRISKGWEQWSRSELLLLECESLGILLPGRLGLGSDFCITGELSRDASAVGWRTTLWVAGHAGEDLCCSRAHQACGGLVSAYLSSPIAHYVTAHLYLPDTKALFMFLLGAIYVWPQGFCTSETL